MDYLAARFIVGIEGSFGVLNYPLLALAAVPEVTGSGVNVEDRPDSLTAGLLKRGFRAACNADFADIALKAQPADGSIRCDASADGLLSLAIDDERVWSRRYPADAETALWCKAAQTREVTIVSGDHLRITDNGVDPSIAAQKKTLVMARIPTVWG